MEDKIRMPIYEARKEAASTAYHFTIGMLIGTINFGEDKAKAEHAAELLKFMRRRYDTELADLRERYDVDDLRGDLSQWRL